MAAAVLAAEFGARELGRLVSLGERSTLEEMTREVTRRVAEQASQEYGLEVVGVRLRRLNYPEEVQTAVFEQIAANVSALPLRPVPKARARPESSAAPRIGTGQHSSLRPSQTRRD